MNTDPAWRPLQFHNSYSESHLFGSSHDSESGRDSGSQPFSSSTTSSSSPTPGPGYLAGKAIKALGSFTVRSLDRVIIYTRIKTTFSYFPHTDAQVAKAKGIDKVYDTLLELSRCAHPSPFLSNV